MRRSEARVKKDEFTDEAWARIAPLLPENGRRGGQWRDHRKVMNGILWKLRTALLGATCPSAMGPGKPATIASPAGAGTAPGTGYWPMPKPRATRPARSHGWSAWTAPSPGRTSMPRVPVEGLASKTQKGGLTSRGRGARVQPQRADDQAAPGLRRQGTAAVGGRDSGLAPREHPAQGGTRRDTCEGPR